MIKIPFLSSQFEHRHSGTPPRSQTSWGCRCTLRKRTCCTCLCYGRKCIFQNTPCTCWPCPRGWDPGNTTRAEEGHLELPGQPMPMPLPTTTSLLWRRIAAKIRVLWATNKVPTAEGTSSRFCDSHVELRQINKKGMYGIVNCDLLFDEWGKP